MRFSLQWIFSSPELWEKIGPYRNRAMLLISHIKGYLEKNLISVGEGMLFVLGHQSELWRFSLCIIDFLFQQEDEHFPAAVTHQASFRGLEDWHFNILNQELVTSPQPYLLWTGGEHWNVAQVQEITNHAADCLHNSIIKVTIITQNSSLWRFQWFLWQRLITMIPEC